ncbi:MAG: MFS transporter [Planctomycetia bacterium]|nr:MFS transporter [Planctomycetia bacterium]
MEEWTPEVQKRFRWWQYRIILGTMLGYALFYFVRKNFSMAMPAMEAELGISKASLGLFLTLNGLIYGFSRFLNGLFADRMNGRFYLAIGLALSAVANFAFGFGPLICSFLTDAVSGESYMATLTLFFGLTLIINSLLQGSGFPPIARLLTHWIPPNELATKMSVWNTSHSIGASIVVILCGYILSAGGDTNFATLRVSAPIDGVVQAEIYDGSRNASDADSAWKPILPDENGIMRVKDFELTTSDCGIFLKNFPPKDERYTARLTFEKPIELAIPTSDAATRNAGTEKNVVQNTDQNPDTPKSGKKLTRTILPRSDLEGTKFDWSNEIAESDRALIPTYTVNIIRSTGLWRYCFWIPAGLAFLGALSLCWILRDTPSTIGLPEIPGTEVVVHKKGMEPGSETDLAEKADYKQLVWERVFGNPFIWTLSIANFFVYTVRLGVLDWGPTMLKESKHLSLEHAGWMVAMFEICGIIGMLVAGWATDRLLRGYSQRTCVFCMLGTALFMFLFWSLPPEAPMWLMFVCLGFTGFFIYGPQALIGIAVANHATKKCAATANGVTGIFGYLSGILSGVGMGWVVQHFGWDIAYICMIGIAGVCVAVFMLVWNSSANGYSTEK